jgi:hypothetical protein
MKTKLSLRSIVTLLLCLFVTLSLSSCSQDSVTNSSEPPTATATATATFSVTSNGTSENYADYSLPPVSFSQGDKISVSFDYLVILNPDGTNFIQFFGSQNLPCIFMVGSLPHTNFEYLPYSSVFTVYADYTNAAPTLRLTVQNNCIVLSVKNLKIKKLK